MWNLERMFNRREGFSAKDGTLPERFLAESLPDGPAAGHTVPLGQLLADYYRVRGGDSKGCPTGETLARLRLEDCRS